MNATLQNMHEKIFAYIQTWSLLNHAKMALALLLTCLFYDPAPNHWSAIRGRTRQKYDSCLAMGWLYEHSMATMSYAIWSAIIDYVIWLAKMWWLCNHRRVCCCLLMMTSSNGNIFRVTGPLCGESFPSQRPLTWSFDVFLDLCLNKRLSKQWWGSWFETPSCSLWCHCNVLGFSYLSTGHARVLYM